MIKNDILVKPVPIYMEGVSYQMLFLLFQLKMQTMN